MKRILLFTTVLSLTITAHAQGFLEWGNNFAGLFRAPIYGTEFYPDAPEPIYGQSSLGMPIGPYQYHAALLSGTGYSFAVYAGPASVTDSSALTFLVSTTFRTATSTGLPRGLVLGGTVAVPGVLAGEPAKFQIRAWDNQGGTLTSWEMSIFTYARGASPMVTSGPLGGVGTDNVSYPNPITDGWTSFSFWIPEPSTWLLAVTGAVGLALGRRRLRSTTNGRNSQQ